MSDIKTIAVACQGGGTHAAFSAGVLTEILHDAGRGRFKLIGLSGTSAGALCALMAWYGLAPKNGRPGSAQEARDTLNRFWDSFSASTLGERALDFFSYSALKAQEQEAPVLGINAPVFSLNPRGAVSQFINAGLPFFGVRPEYASFDEIVDDFCPSFDQIDWGQAETRLVLGASEIVNGVEVAFDSDCNDPAHDARHYEPTAKRLWRRRLPITRQAVAASGTLPRVRAAEQIDGGFYWDGLYSQNPPVREFFSGTYAAHAPDEIWVVRINPQQRAAPPVSNAEIQDRENELMGNLSLNKELDFLLSVNDWIGKLLADPANAGKYKLVTARTIKMKEATAERLRTSSKFQRSRDFIDGLRAEGRAVARGWLDRWPMEERYPEDAAYRSPPAS